MTLAERKMRGDIEFDDLVNEHGAQHDAYDKPNLAFTSFSLFSFSHVNNSTSRVNVFPSASKNVLVTTSLVRPMWPYLAVSA